MSVLVVGTQFVGMDQLTKIQAVLDALSDAVGSGALSESEVNRIARIQVYNHTELL